MDCGKYEFCDPTKLVLLNRDIQVAYVDYLGHYSVLSGSTGHAAATSMPDCHFPTSLSCETTPWRLTEGDGVSCLPLYDPRGRLNNKVPVWWVGARLSSEIQVNWIPCYVSRRSAKHRLQKFQQHRKCLPRYGVGTHGCTAPMQHIGETT